MAVWVCYDIAKKNLRYNIVMIVLATAELYGGTHRRYTVPDTDLRVIADMNRIRNVLPGVARRQHQP